MKRQFFCVAAIVASACSGGGLAGDDLCARCAASEGCVRARVVRAETNTSFPWTFKVSPNPADGVGTLTVVAYTVSTMAPSLIARATLANADFRDRGASALLDVGCVPPRPVLVNAILDENQPLGADDLGSSDGFDTCARPRPASVSVAVGQVATVEMSLAQSCNP
jgi:hypothetical protein